MNLEKLTEGMVLKNYKELCEVLGEKIKGGKSKTLQLKELERFIKYRKEGNKFIIEEVFETPKEKIDNRGKSEGSRGNNTVYFDKILDAFLCMVVQMAEKTDEEDIVLIKSTSELMRDMAIRNQNYEIAKYTPHYYSQQTNTDVTNVKKIVQEKDNYDHSAFNSVCNALDKSDLCTVINTIYVEVPLLDEHSNIKTDKDGNVLYNGKTKRREATKKEFIEIKDIKRNVMMDMGYDSMWYIVNNEKLSKEFYRKVDDLTLSKLGIIRNYPKREFHFKKSTLIKYLQKFKGLTYEDIINIGNETYYNRIASNITKKSEGIKNGTKILKGDNGVMLKENFINDIDIVIPNITYTDAMVIEPITLEEEMELARQQMIASAKAKAWII